jgi:hypothetical protein
VPTGFYQGYEEYAARIIILLIEDQLTKSQPAYFDEMTTGFDWAYNIVIYSRLSPINGVSGKI